MPKEITHWIVADAALTRLQRESALGREILAHRSLFLAGAVLPDTLLHIFKGTYHPAARTLAHRFHDAPGNSYDPIIQAESGAGTLTPALRACLCGVLSHIHADMIMHPYVYSVSGRHDIGRHYALETAIDVHFLSRGRKAPARLMGELVTAQTRPVLAEAAALLFDPQRQLPPQALELALTLHCRFQGMYNRALWKVAALVLAKLAGSPFREQRHLFYPLLRRRPLPPSPPWHCPVSGALRHGGVEELCEEAVQRTVATLERVESLGSFAAALQDPPGANLLTGCHGVTESGMH